MKVKKIFPDSSIHKLFDELKDIKEKGVTGIVTVHVTADEQLIGKTLTITNGTESFSKVVPAEMKFDFNLNTLGIWTLVNPVTGKEHKLEVNYYGQYDLDVKCYRRFTVIIDHEIADPEKCCTYADNAVGMEPGGDGWWNETIFKDLKNCVLVNGAVAYYLNKDNLAQKEDGSPADITTLGHDVMLEIPYRVGYKFEWLDTNRLSVSITDHPNDPEYYYDAFSLYEYNDCDKLYVGVYKGYYENNMLYSSSNKVPVRDILMSSFRTAAKNRGPGFFMKLFSTQKLLQCMYLVFYKNLDSQEAVSYGNVSNSTTDHFHLTGTGNSFGFMTENLTKNIRNSGKDAVKCFGIEHLWGEFWEFTDGIYADKSGNAYTCECAFYVDDSSKYKNNGNLVSTMNIYAPMNRPVGSNEMGFSTYESKGTDSTFYCDVSSRGNGYDTSVSITSGCMLNGNQVGIMACLLQHPTTHKAPDTSARLIYLHKEV